MAGANLPIWMCRADKALAAGWFRGVAGAALALGAGSASAQDNALRSAADAFGERVGIEQSGLYSESQVRGFDLNDSGAYRIDEAYFSRAQAPADGVLAGVSVRVGVNAARLSYPAPSGVVNYRLRDAAPTNQLRLAGGFRDFGTRVAQADVSWRSGDVSLAGGVVWLPQWRLSGGNRGAGVSGGVVVGWTVAPGHRLRVFGSINDREYDGDYAIVATASALPPNLRRPRNYSPDWARTVGTTINYGLLYRGDLHGFAVDASAFRSTFSLDNADNTLVSSDAAGNASAVTLRTPERDFKQATSGEIRVERGLNMGDFEHALGVSLRGRRTVTELASSLAIPLGVLDLVTGEPAEALEVPWSGTRGLDTVDQYTASASYGLTWRDRAQLRFGLHRTHYAKAGLSPGGVESEQLTEATNYNISAVVSLTRQADVFGSWVTGLEESGSAPASAINREEVLPPVETRQIELGVRYTPTPRLTVIAALFDVSKPGQGFRSDRSFGVVGEVRHRGVESSIAGQVTSTTTVLAGVSAFGSEVTGPLVDAGVIGRTAAGVSRLVVSASLEQKVRDGWSVDVGVSHLGERWADTANSFSAPAVTTISLGARGRFALGRRTAELRLLASNLADEHGYVASPSGLLNPISPRTVRAILTIPFGTGD